MKKIFTKLMLLAVAATALVSCDKNFEEQTFGGELTQTVTLSAEKPAEVRTQLVEGVPYWSAGDKIGVYTTEKNLESEYYLTNDSKEATLATTFTGTTALSETIFVFYPSMGYGTTLETGKGAKTLIPATQKPTATSFDGAADIMFAKPVTLDAEGKQLSDLEFARLGAIVKVVLKDKTGNLANQHISSLTMTAATNLTGRVYLDVVNQKLGELYYGQAKSVTAEYTDATQYEVNGTNATYVIVYPQTLKSGSKLTIEAATEGYAISKVITLAEDIALESGKVTTLNVSLAAENVEAEATGLALPFEDNFSWVTTTSTTAYSSITSAFPKKDGAAMYSAVSYVYPETKQVKFGSSSNFGYLTTSELNLSKPFTVVVVAKRYSSDSSQLKVTAGGVSKTSANLGADYTYYMFEFDAVGSKEKVRFDITGKRGYINNITIVEGHDYVLPPVLTVSNSEISVSNEAATQTFTYNVANPVDGVNVAISDNADWITTSVSGTTVTVTIAENTTDEAREGVITVTYGELTKTVTVKQNAKPAEGGGSTGGAWVRVTSTADILSGGKFIIGYEASANSGKLVPMRSDKCAATTTANGIFYSGTAVGTTTSNNSTIDMKTITATTAYEFTVTASTSVSGAINIQMADGKYLGSPNSKNTGRLYASASKNTAYGMTMAANNVVTLKCAAASSYHTLQYNTSSPRFANYGGTQKNVVFYKWVE